MFQPDGLSPRVPSGPRRRHWLLPSIMAVVALALLAPAANAKQAIDFFGGPEAFPPDFLPVHTLGGQFGRPAGVVVNDSGAGPANAGDIYVADAGRSSSDPIANRVQRFGRDDNGTPGNTADDSYFFISAWGADVVQSGGTGDLGDAAAKNYEICTVASQCDVGVDSGGNGTAAGNGSFSFSSSINVGEPGLAVDQDTGDVYVTDPGNARVNVYDGAGVFLRSFGFDVVASGPDDTGSGFEVCDAEANPTDVCKAGVPGAGTGQVGLAALRGAQGIAVSTADSNPATGKVFLADTINQRVNVYNLDGSVYEDPSLNERDRLAVSTTAGTYTLNFNAQTSAPIPYDASAATVQSALEAFTGIDPGDVSVSGGPGDLGATSPYEIAFGGALAGTDVPDISANGAFLDSVNRLAVNATSGTYKLRFTLGNGSLQTTAAIPYDASAATVQSALEALSNLSAGQVTVTGGPGNAGATTPYTISFDAAAVGGVATTLGTAASENALKGGTTVSGAPLHAATLTTLSSLAAYPLAQGRGSAIGSATIFLAAIPERSRLTRAASSMPQTPPRSCKVSRWSAMTPKTPTAAASASSPRSHAALMRLKM